jgi:thiosulfate/3-mercaptopyruvate sulfurtransferase
MPSIYPDLLITPEQLVSQKHPHLPPSASGLVIIDCRFSLADPTLGYQQYQIGHIPGAHYLDLNADLSAPAGPQGGRHPLPDVAELTAKLAQLGVGPQTLVVAYDDSRFAFAARLWWLLRWLGHERVVVLDGGLAAYQAAGYPLSTEIPTPAGWPAEPLTFCPQPDWVVDSQDVMARKDQPGVVLIDSREPERYRGEREPIDPIAGHIPGALNSPWQQVSDSTGHLLPQTHWQPLLPDAPPVEEIFIYCGSGVTACVNLLGLAAAGVRLGPGGAKLYAGSWSDWCTAAPAEIAVGPLNPP